MPERVKSERVSAGASREDAPSADATEQLSGF